MPDLVTSFPLLIGVAVAGYLLGSIPFGIVMARLFGLGDLRQIGSGNIGATNVLRTGNKVAAFLTLIGDAGKGGAAVLLARALFAEDAAQLAGFAAFLGHCFPVFSGLQGWQRCCHMVGHDAGLGLPAGIGRVCHMACDRAGLPHFLACRAWSRQRCRRSSRWCLAGTALFLFSVALAALIFYRHSANITRIIAGEEPRIGRK